jgi:hypothetical protein
LFLVIRIVIFVGTSPVNIFYIARFEVITAVNMKNALFWDVATYGSCKK